MHLRAHLVLLLVLHAATLARLNAGAAATEAPGSEGGCQRAAGSTSADNVTEILEKIVNTSAGYDRRIRPYFREKPVLIGVSIWVSDVSAISEVSMDYTLDFYFRQTWTDPRLQFDASMEELAIGAEMAERIWKPDTFFVNAKKASFHEATMRNTFIRIYNTGKVFISLRMTVVASCHMDLTYFPMDSQMCKLEVESFGYKDNDIFYVWSEFPKYSVGIDHNVQLPQFRVGGSRECNKTISLSTGNYSRLVVEIFFHRSMGYYLIQIYVPSILIVVLSWVSFWLSRDAVPARVALGITTVLTMTTLISSTNASLPKISYLKSIDVYLVTCFIMVFASLLEYAAVSYIGKRGEFSGMHHHGGVKGGFRKASSAYVAQMSPVHCPSCLRCFNCFQFPPSREMHVGHCENRHVPADDSPTMTEFVAMQPNSPIAPRFWDTSSRRKYRQDMRRSSVPSFTSPDYQQRSEFDYDCEDTHAGFDTEIRLTSIHAMQTQCEIRQPDAEDVAVTRCYTPRGVPASPTNSPRRFAPPQVAKSNCWLLDNMACLNFKSSLIDKYARIGFPLIFTVFNVMYWILYLNISEQYNTKRYRSGDSALVTCI